MDNLKRHYMLHNMILLVLNEECGCVNELTVSLSLSLSLSLFELAVAGWFFYNTKRAHVSVDCDLPIPTAHLLHAKVSRHVPCFPLDCYKFIIAPSSSPTLELAIG
jgi:hypothetical protein